MSGSCSGAVIIGVFLQELRLTQRKRIASTEFRSKDEIDLATGRFVTSKKTSLCWPVKWPRSPTEVLLREHFPQNIHGRLISTLTSIRPDIDDGAGAHNSRRIFEDAIEELSVSFAMLELASIATAHSSGVRWTSEHPQTEPLVIVVVGNLKIWGRCEEETHLPR